LTYPDIMPVLSFIKQDGNLPGWRVPHEQQLANIERGELVELDGALPHWTHSAQIASTMDSFLTSDGMTG